MTCQDNCLYYPLCRDSGFLMYSVRTAKTLTLTENVEKECPFKKFKNKADFVEVVRCVECGFRDDNLITTSQDIDCYMCKRHHSLVLLDDFCSYGERK